MEILVNTLGLEGARRFLTQSLPLIQQRNRELRESLAQGDWVQAAKLAHSIKGTINLYGSASLIEALENIVNQNTSHIYDDEFLQKLQAEQQEAESAVVRFLSQ
jgi:HPt (histidine-containing phosphotransfer) domain-containing protein